MKNHDTVISYITLAVTDISAMTAFYRGLGYSLYKQSDDNNHPYTMFTSGGIILALYPKQHLAEHCGIEIDSTAKNNAMALSLNVENKSMVDELLAKAKVVNAEIVREGFEPAWGGYCTYIRDPEANLWEIVWHEHFAFNKAV